jgi:uncharacterized protein YhaN
MGPKKNSLEPPTTTNNHQPSPSHPNNNELLAKIDELTRTISSFGRRFDNLESLWKDTKAENNMLKAALQEKEREIVNVRERMNEHEQYTRSWSIRVLNMNIPPDEATDPFKVMNHLYKRLLLPIFQGAVEQGLLNSIPPVEQVLETAHILPSKPGSNAPNKSLLASTPEKLEP